MRVAALVLAYLVLLAYGAFGWAHRRFTLPQVTMVSVVTGVLVGILLGIATEADRVLVIIITSFFAVGFGIVGTLFSWLNRRRAP